MITPTEIRVQNPNKLRLALLTAAGLAGLYYLLGYVPVVMWIAAIVIAISLVYRAIRGQSNDPVITIDERGVCDKRLKVGVILWEDIRRAVPYSLHGVEYLSLELHNMKAYEARRPLWLKALSQVQRLFGMSSISISASNLDMDPETLVDRIEEGCGAVSRRTVEIG
jgi:hypothetical protein